MVEMINTNPPKLNSSKSSSIYSVVPSSIQALLFMLLLIAAISVVIAAPKRVPPAHSLDNIYMEVESFLQKMHLDSEGAPIRGVTIKVRPLDSRLRLKKCSTPLDVSFQSRRKRVGRVIVAVRCLGSTPWRLYVSATIQQLQKVVVTTSAILKGEKVGEDDLGFEEREVTALYGGYFSLTKDVIGKYAQRLIQESTLVTPNMLFIPDLIKKGDRVNIILKRGSLQIQMKGVALENAHRDARLRVKNSSSGKEIEGVAVSAGRVIVE